MDYVHPRWEKLKDPNFTHYALCNYVFLYVASYILAIILVKQPKFILMRSV